MPDRRQNDRREASKKVTISLTNFIFIFIIFTIIIASIFGFAYMSVYGYNIGYEDGYNKANEDLSFKYATQSDDGFSDAYNAALNGSASNR